MDTDILIHIELLVGSIGVILALFFAIFIFTGNRNGPKANIFLAIYLLAFSLRIGKSLFHNYFEVSAPLRTLLLTVLLCVGPSIWLYSKYLIEPIKNIRRKDWFHYLPFLILICISWLIPNDGTSSLFGFFYDFLTLHMSIYTGFSIYYMYAHYKGENASKGNKTRNWLSFFLILNLLFLLFYFLISTLRMPFYMGISFLFSLVIVLLSFWALRNPFLFTQEPEKYKNSSLKEKEGKRIMKTLKTYMDMEKPFLDPDLTLMKLSEAIGVNGKKLSQAINQEEQINYSQFISQYRVEEVKRLMQLSSHANFTIAAIAYESGFNSISSFNAQFKKITKVTAVNYRESLKS